MKKERMEIEDERKRRTVGRGQRTEKVGTKTERERKWGPKEGKERRNSERGRAPTIGRRSVPPADRGPPRLARSYRAVNARDRNERREAEQAGASAIVACGATREACHIESLRHEVEALSRAPTLV